jgi:hypothetical protein
MKSGAGNQGVILNTMYCLDGSDEYINISANERVDEAYESNFAGMNPREIFWIQNVHGGGDTGGGTVISTTDDGDGDGYTDTVTLDAGLFDTANIDITKDWLAWREPGAPAVSGYLRTTDKEGLAAVRPYGDGSGNVARAPQGSQAMSRIIDIATGGQIIVEDDMIPDNLSGVEWEVRRPAVIDGSRTSTDPDVIYISYGTGCIDHLPANESASRRFRITKNTIFRK